MSTTLESPTLPITSRLRERDVTGAALKAPTARRRTVADLADGEEGLVLGVTDRARPDVARRLFDLGFMPGVTVTRIRRAPLRGPIVVRVADYELTLRGAQAAAIVLAGAADARSKDTAADYADAAADTAEAAVADCRVRSGSREASA